ncbi:MAG: iron donor protein CyaY [Pseudomonadota bacterium]
MNEQEFNKQTDSALQKIEAMLESSDLDLDFEWVSDGVLSIELAGGAKIVVNRHAAAQEIWVAAKSGGFHYRWDGVCWRDTRNQDELMMALSSLLNAKS